MGIFHLFKLYKYYQIGQGSMQASFKAYYSYTETVLWKSIGKYYSKNSIWLEVKKIFGYSKWQTSYWFNQ